jgi:ubiquinone/menaquinone biosynthesis C-methylase UbiE
MHLCLSMVYLVCRRKWPWTQSVQRRLLRGISERVTAVNLTPPDEYRQIREDARYAADFTRMLYEIHIPLAEELANLLDLRGVKRFMDLGGGSGVVSFALLRKQHDLTSVVVDVETVCQFGREIASENGPAKRMTYLAADFL